jgi:hypothetical protein
MASFDVFAVRQNRDSSIDSICTQCYQTMHRRAPALTFTFAEQGRVCDPNGEFNLHHDYSILCLILAIIVDRVGVG